MKKILLIALLLSVGFCQQKKTDEPNLKKGIKIETKYIYRFEEKFGDFKDILNFKQIYKYDTNGNMVEELTHYVKFDNIPSNYNYSKRIYKYDSNENKVEQSIIRGRDKTSWSPSSLMVWKSKYDTNGNMIDESCYVDDGSLFGKKIFKYDSNGNEVEYQNHSKLNEYSMFYESNRSNQSYNGFYLEEKHEFKYDNYGNKVEYINYGLYGEMPYKTIYKYDTNGNMVEELDYNSDGLLTDKQIYKYDTNGNMVEVLDYTSDGLLTDKQIYKYDSKNRIIESQIYNYKLKFGELQQTPTKKTTYEYEEH